MGILALGGQYGASLRNSHDTWLMIFIAAGAAALVFLCEFAIKLFRAPVKIMQEKEKKLASIEKEKSELLEAFNSISNKKELERAEAKNLKIVKNTLGLYLEIIEHWNIRLDGIDWVSITDKAIQKEILDWSETKLQIFNFLRENYSGAEASYFGALVGTQQIVIDDNNALSPERKKQRQFLTNETIHHAKQLRALIEKKI